MKNEESSLLPFHITTRSEAETISAGEHLGMVVRGGDVVLLDGHLGAGKTRFSKGVARGLGIHQEVISPTFNLVLEYPLMVNTTDENSRQRATNENIVLEVKDENSAQSPKTAQAQRYVRYSHEEQQEPSRVLHTQHPRILRHFDLYRLEHEEDLDDLDFFGLIEEEDAVSLVEWGSKFPESLPLDYLSVHITQNDADPQQRTLSFYAKGPRSEETLRRFITAGNARRLA